MRVIMKDGAISTPCEQFTYGEVEDYTVNFVSGTSTTPSTSTLSIGSGTASTGNAPYGTYYMDERCQFIITKSELTAAGFTSAKNIIKSLAFNIATLSSQVMNGFTIKIGHTTAANFGTSTAFSTNAMTTVFSGNLSPASGWNTHTFGTPFTYNGVDNLIIDICWNNSSYTTDSKVYYSTTTDNKTLYYKSDVASGGVCGNISGSLSTSRPNMRFVFGSASGSSAKESESVEAMAVTNGFALYPNPASSNLSLSYQLNSPSEVRVTLHNLMGALIMQQEQGVQTEGNYMLNLELNNYPELVNGIYLCTMTMNGTSTTKRFIIAR
jgi:hypothetical protein